MIPEKKKTIDSFPVWKYFLITIPIYFILFYGISFILHLERSWKETLINAVSLSIVFRFINKGLNYWNNAWKKSKHT